MINCAWFGSCVFSDYFSAILGLVRQGNSWSLNPFGVELISFLIVLDAELLTLLGGVL